MSCIWILLNKSTHNQIQKITTDTQNPTHTGNLYPSPINLTKSYAGKSKN